MSMNVSPRLMLFGLLLALVPAACGGEHDGAHAPGTTDAAEHAHDDPHAHHGHGDLPATAGPGYTVDDVRFMQMMIAHHDQALRMAALVPDRTERDDMRRLALRIDISQKDEIEFMEGWLRERGQAIPDEALRLSMDMPGTVTPEQFDALRAARGTAFDRLFLEFMIEHHLGALEMVDEVFQSPGSTQDSDLFRFVTDVGADQGDEILAMERLLARLETP